MKVRPFLSLLLAFSLLAFGLGIAGWWQVWRQGPFHLAHLPLSVPRAARFVPRQAPMSLFLFSDGEQPLDYARAVAPPGHRREAVDTLAALRDGAFAAAGLASGPVSPGPPAACGAAGRPVRAQAEGQQ